MDIDKPLKQILNPDNIEDRIQETEDAVGAQPSATVESSSQLSGFTGTQIVGNLISPGVGVTDLEPTSTDFTGSFVSGEGVTFNSTVYNMGGVNAGTLQWGARQDDGSLLAGAGGVTLGANGISLLSSTSSTGDETSSVSFKKSGVEVARLMHLNASGLNTLQLLTIEEAGQQAYINIAASNSTTDAGYVQIFASDSDGTAYVVVRASETTGGTSVNVKGDNINIGQDFNENVNILGKLNVQINPSTDSFVHAGTYTPTLTGVANVTGSTAYECQYMRVGKVVTVSGRVDVDPTANSVQTTLGISLPIASELTATNQCGGTAAHGLVAGYSGYIIGDITNNRAQLQFIVGDNANRAWMFTFTYLIA